MTISGDDANHASVNESVNDKSDDSSDDQVNVYDSNYAMYDHDDHSLALGPPSHQ